MASTTTPTRYIYGTTRLGDENIAFADRVELAKSAIEAGLWLHTSNQYGNALAVFKAALTESNRPVEGTIFKIGWDSVSQIREQIEKQLEASGLSRMTLGQLCLGGALAADFSQDGEQIEALLGLQKEGLVQEFVLELWPWSSKVGLAGLKNGNARKLLKAFIFYCNPMQRFVSNELWDAMQADHFPFIAMRTVAGGSVYRARDIEGAAPDYLKERAALVAPIFENSGCETWTEFCMRFVSGFEDCIATVGSTANSESFNLFQTEAKNAKPLDPQIQDDLLSLQRLWSDEHDIHAKEWSM